MTTNIGSAPIRRADITEEEYRKIQSRHHTRSQTLTRPNTLTPETQHVTFAASSATEEEEKIARLGKHTDGSKPIKVQKRIWRPQVRSEYHDEETEIDPSENLDWLFKDNGKTMMRTTNTLTPRDDIVTFDTTKHSREFETNIQWRDCPAQHQNVISEIIREYWDVFC
jgi:hypothetical protein